MKVIYLMADTLRRDHLGTYGNKWIHTPNLDRLAAGAAMFDRAYIGSFPTVPNRRDTLLGRGDRGVPFNRWKVIERDEVTLPERLREKKIPSMLILDTQNNATGGMNMFKGYTAWSHKAQFAALKPVKGGSAVLGLAVTPDASPRLAEPKNESWSERLKAKLPLASPAEVDAEVKALLKAAWERS